MQTENALLDKKARRRLVFRFGAAEFTYWFSLAAANYLTVFMDALGYSPAQVSLVTSINSGVGIVSTPLWGTISDKIRSPRKTLIICLICFALTYALVPLASGVFVFGLSLMFIVIPLSQFFRAPTWPLIDNLVINGCRQTGIKYGPVRSLGSISFVIMNLTLGSIIMEKNAWATFYVLGATMLLAILAVYSLKIVPEAAASAKPLKFKEMPFGKLFKNPYFIAYIIFSIIQFIPQMSMFTFQPYLVKAVGADMAYIGYIQAYRAIFEVPTLLLSHKLQKRMSFKTMVVIAGALNAAQAILCGFVGTFGELIAITTLAGIASGFTQAGTVNYVFTIAPKELRATAQTVAGATQSVAGIIGGILGGVFVEALGIKSFYVVTGFIMIFAITFFLLSAVFIKKVLKREFVDQTAL